MKRWLAAALLGLRAQTRSGHLARMALRLDPGNLRALWVLYLKRNKGQTVMRRLPDFLRVGVEDAVLAGLLERHFYYCRAQFFQDLQFLKLFPHYESERGYFVEIGVGDGVHLSNTYLLEQSLGWDGLLVEANPDCWENIENKRRALLRRQAAWCEDGQTLEFVCTSTPEFSGLKQTSCLRTQSLQEKLVLVEGVQTERLLVEAGAPDHIPFLSLDTEGSELKILEGIDFQRRSFDFLCVEHGGDVTRQRALLGFMAAKGYVSVLADQSEIDFWFVPEELVSTLPSISLPHQSSIEVV